MTVPYSGIEDGGVGLPSTDGVPTGYSLFFDASSGIAKWGQSSISTTGANDLDILTYKSSTNKIVWSSASINLKNFIAQSATPQLYGTFFGTDAGDHIGGVDITANGDYIVIGYYHAKQSTDASTAKRGLVRVYKSTDKTNDTWEQVGGDIYGSTTTSEIGKQVVIAHDNPNRIAIREENPACVRVYEYSGGTWSINSTVTGYSGTTFLVANFEANSAGDNNIHAVRLSNNGNRLVMSDITNGGVGKLVVYDYISSSSTWTPTNIVHPYGVTEVDRYGFAVAMSGDGNRIITSFPANRDLVRIVDYINGSWSWTSHTFTGTSGSKTGFSVAISSDGTTIAYVQPEFTVVHANVGRVLVYREETNGFVSEATLNGTQQHGRLGHRFWDGNSGNATSVPSGWESELRSYFSSNLTLNNDGRRLAVGSWFHDNSTQERGLIKIYDKSPTTNSWSVTGSANNQNNTFIDILGDNETNGYFGASLAMASDGIHFAGVGAYDDNSAGTDSGIAKTYILPDALNSGTVFYGTDGILRIVP